MSRPIASRERPILMSAPMVNAILAGRKSQTRRVVSPQPARQPTYFEPHRDWFVDGDTWCRLCPYGSAGDRLWVRETWAEVSDEYGTELIAYRADASARIAVSSGPRGAETFGTLDGDGGGAYDVDIWRPSIFMPRWASRILLEVTEVRVERVQKISEADAQAEGIEPYQGTGPITQGQNWSRMRFHDLWDSINAKRGFGWDSNPWVWVISFRPLASPLRGSV